jgi:hypothetical protein
MKPYGEYVYTYIFTVYLILKYGLDVPMFAVNK